MKAIMTNILRLMVLATLLAATTSVFAQNPIPVPAVMMPPPLDPQANWPVKIFELKNVDPTEMKSILSIFRAEVVVPASVNSRSRLLSVRAPKEIMPAIEETIARFDVPPPPVPPSAPTKMIEVSVQVIGAYDTPDFSACGSCAIPASLQPVVSQLQKNFSYKSYQLLDTQMFRQSNYSKVKGTASLPGMNDPFASYTIQWQAILGERPVVRLDGLNFTASVTLKSEGSTSSGRPFGFDSSLEIPAGQQVVVGKTIVGSAAIILVIRANVVD